MLTATALLFAIVADIQLQHSRCPSGLLSKEESTRTAEKQRTSWTLCIMRQQVSTHTNTTYSARIVTQRLHKPVMRLCNQSCMPRFLHTMSKLFSLAAAFDPAGYMLHEVKPAGNQQVQQAGLLPLAALISCGSCPSKHVLKAMLLHNATGEKPMA